MKQLQLPLRLGQRVYAVTKSGVIFPTLVNEVTLTTDPTSDEFLVMCDLLLSGKQHRLTDMPLQFRTISRAYDEVLMTFAEALSNAKEHVQRRLLNPSIKLDDLAKYQTLMARYLDEADSVQAEVDAIDAFTEEQTGMLSRGESGVYTAADFPSRYYEPGTSVWVVDYKRVVLIDAVVTEVGFAPRRVGRVRYVCGSYSNLSCDEVWGSKRAALKRLRKHFESRHPATLDARRVPVEQQISRSEQHKRDVARFFAGREKR